MSLYAQVALAKILSFLPFFWLKPLTRPAVAPNITLDMAEEVTTPHEGATPVRGSDVMRLVRMSLRPPTRFAAGADFTLWLTRFEMYTQQADIAEPQRVKEFLSLLEDEPFRVVSQHGLLETGDYGAVTGCLQQHYAPDGNELEWQYKLQTRTQRPGEQLADFAGALRVLTDKAYPILGPLNSGRKFYEGNLYPRNSLLVSAALVDARGA